MKTLPKPSNRHSSAMRLVAAFVAGFVCATIPAQAQIIFHVGGENVIADTALTTVAEGPKLVATVPRGGVHWTTSGGDGGGYSKLKSPTLTVPNTGPVTLKFTHRYNFEQLWDGGAVYVNLNGAGSTYVDTSAFASNGYGGALIGSVFTGGEQAFTGKSLGYDTSTLIESVVNLGTLTAGDTIAIEFRGGWDEGWVEAAPNWEIATVAVRDSANAAVLTVDFLNGAAGFTTGSDAGLVGPWRYLGPKSQFEISSDLMTADRYVPDSPGPNTIIDISGADLAVVLVAGTLKPGDSFTLFDFSGGTTLRGTYNSITLPPGNWDMSNLGVTGQIVYTSSGTPPAITNVRAAQRAGTNLVDIDYDVTGTTLPLKITLEVSADDGTTYNIPAISLSGSAGYNVTPATNLRLTWDAGKDWGGRFSTTMRYKVVADDAPPPEGFALIPTGPFQMGDSFGEGSGSDEVPVHTVQVNAFYMAKYLVTKAMWDEVRAWGAVHGYTDLSAGTGKVATHPVQSITWNDILKWCNARSEKDGLTPCYMVSEVVYRTGQSDAVVCNWSASGYRLPTETEWEKAARGGLSGKRFPWGDTITHSEANFWNGGGEFYQSGSTGFHPTYDDGVYPYTSPVGSFAPNGFGLYDMVGNVYEWCWDWYGSYPSTSPADPRGAASGSFRVGRGGCWRNGAFYCRSAFRGRFNPGDSGISLGCRIARSSGP